MEKLIVSSSPHFNGGRTTQNIMLDVIIALVPAMVASVILFGFRAAVVILTCVATCVLSEYLCRRVMKRPQTVGDLSCVVTGILLALNLPVTINPLIAVFGGVVAIVVVIHAVNRRVLQLKYSLIWLLISLCLVAAALFPKIAFAVTALVGIETPSNLIFFLAIIALLGICFSLTVIVSRQEARIKRLIQILSIEHNELKGSEEEEDAATERDNK